MRLALFILLVVQAFSVSAEDAADLLALVQGVPGHVQRIELLSRHLMGRPYVEGGFGEGPGGKYDNDPLYRFDSFDCTSFVETVTALTFARTPLEFEDDMNHLRYAHGAIGFTTRNHFPDADWIPNTIAEGFYSDLTGHVMGEVPASIATALIDKPSWYRAMPLSRVQRPDLTEPERERLLEELHAEGDAFEAKEVSIPYVPFTALFDAEGHANAEVFDRLPSGAVVSIVRPNWNLKPVIGSNLNISHQGLLVRVNGVVYLRHASSAAGKVVEQPLADYLRAALSSPTIKAIHVLETR